jgi:hypothetical protein
MLPRTLIFFLTAAALTCVQARQVTVATLPAPAGYTRLSYPAGSYSDWISHLPLKDTRQVATYSGGTVADDYYNVFAVVDMPLLFKQDLEQCADFSFRFWAEYHKEKGSLDKLYLFDYNGKRRLFKTSGKSFREFLKWTMVHANSHSLKMGTVAVEPDDDVRPGDMIVQNEDGGIGHVSVIMDVCVSDRGERLYLIGFSFMPAQEFHIEKACASCGSGGWYSLDGYFSFLKAYLDLGNPVVRRFAQP